MANDNKPKYVRIGFTVLVGAAAIAATLVYLGGFGGRDSEVLVESYYDKPVSGLSAGSAVNFRGVKIGEVRNIRLGGLRAGDLTTAGAQRVRILMAIDLRKIGLAREGFDDDYVARKMEEYVARGLRATVASSGVTGLSRIELNIVENPPPPAAIAWKPRHPLIPPAPSLMESLSDSATMVMNQINKMDFAPVWSNIQSTADSAARIAASVDAFIESERARVDSMLRSADDAMARLNEVVQRLGDNPSLLLRPADPEPIPETR
ncbi:MAG: MCE family protein [Kiritimatiellae bacterium]|nr:MCE family protein [Kiritimatiellia bacterium]